MKHTFFKFLLLLSAGAFILAESSCKRLEDFGDTNINPNGSVTPITAALLTSAEIRISDVVAGTSTGGNKGGLYAQYFSETQYTDASLYAEPKLDMSEVYNLVRYGTYTGPLMDLQVIINKNTDPATSASVQANGSNGNQIAIAKILKAYYLWTLTDRWGDVPYTQALQGAGNLSPAFDKQSDIYAQLFKDLKDGIASFDGGVAMQGDVLYGGDAAKWKKLANTLRMLVALRMSKVTPAAGLPDAKAEFAAAYADPNGYITTNADNLTLAYPGGSFKNPVYLIYDGRTDYAFSKTIGDIMANMQDPRKNFYKGSGNDFPYGLVRADAIAFGSYAQYLAPQFRSEDAPLVIVSAASSLLAVAEAMELGWITSSNPKDFYERAIAESFAQWGASGAATYAANAFANYTTGTGGGASIGSNAYGSIVGADANTTTPLQRIRLQRYLALYPDGVQAWSEWRRTGIPNLKPTTYATNSDAGGQIPRRYVYATVEYSLNPVQVALAVSRLTGGDKMNSRIWWDQ